MQQPPIYNEDRIDVMQDLMATHPFATLVSSASGYLSADHIPLVVHRQGGEFGVLHGHFAVSNPLFQQSEGPIDVLAIFQGPQTYVTPSWYASKKEHGKVVPTWNYVVVHASGTLEFTREPQWLLRHLEDLTAQHESHRPQPWAVSDAPDDFVARQLKGLVGFEISVEALQGTWKVSQNKTLADWTGVRDGLRQSGDAQAIGISNLMDERGSRKATN